MLRRPPTMVWLREEEVEITLQSVFDKNKVLIALGQLNLNDRSQIPVGHSIGSSSASFQSGPSHGDLDTIPHASVLGSSSASYYSTSIFNEQPTSDETMEEAPSVRTSVGNSLVNPVDTTATITRLRQASARTQYRVTPLRERKRPRIVINSVNLPREHRKGRGQIGHRGRDKGECEQGGSNSRIMDDHLANPYCLVENYRRNSQIRVSARPTVHDEQLLYPTFTNSRLWPDAKPNVSKGTNLARESNLASSSYEVTMADSSANTFQDTFRMKKVDEYFLLGEPKGDRGDVVW
ncbi:hypothetical protein N7468_004596 [Penicillium chermesinum]|uniref:Uncharacterized protein n=1 Tax=Penicillium chermesinum TaxID=63820 RepID=A0A9W9TSX1_9EURO|nr:uncharacterized protein N7468_004596 [Penicillium chermesinum]KAJ5239977.1 hypothetical protein N7468_004596 [Penicillium chermesinum]